MDRQGESTKAHCDEKAESIRPNARSTGATRQSWASNCVAHPGWRLQTGGSSSACEKPARKEKWHGTVPYWLGMANNPVKETAHKKPARKEKWHGTVPYWLGDAFVRLCLFLDLLGILNSEHCRQVFVPIDKWAQERRQRALPNYVVKENSSCVLRNLKKYMYSLFNNLNSKFYKLRVDYLTNIRYTCTQKFSPCIFLYSQEVANNSILYDFCYLSQSQIRSHKKRSTTRQYNTTIYSDKF